MRRALLLLSLSVAGCNGAAPDKPAAAPTAVAEKPKAEVDLSRTTLSHEACVSLGVRNEPARRQRVRETVELPGWVMARQGREVTVTAPVAGYVRAPKDGEVPIPGLPVKQGRELLVLEPVLAPLDQIQLAALKRGVESELAKANEAVTVAASEWERVKDLHRQKLRGQQDLEQAQARLNQAKEDLAAATDKRKLYGDGKAIDSLPPMTLTAPRAGTVLHVAASPGQYVPAAAALVTIIDLTKPWLRVPIPETDLARLDRRAPATVKGAGPPLEARPLALVPQVDAARHTADLIYELPGPPEAVAGPAAPSAPAFAKDQMLTVQVPMGGEAEECVVPYAAVVYDAYAGAWIYLDRTAGDGATGHVYERRRIELGPRIGEKDVVVRPACDPSDKVVVAGAAALYSREFHKPPAK